MSHHLPTRRNGQDDARRVSHEHRDFVLVISIILISVSSNYFKFQLKSVAMAIQKPAGASKCIVSWSIFGTKKFPDVFNFVILSYHSDFLQWSISYNEVFLIQMRLYFKTKPNKPMVGRMIVLTKLHLAVKNIYLIVIVMQCKRHRENETEFTAWRIFFNLMMVLYTVGDFFKE